MSNIIRGTSKEITINDKTFTVILTLDDDGEEILAFPILNSIDKLGRKNFWKIYVKCDNIFRFSWINQGKVKEYDQVTSTPKNVGKSNETTSFEQALLEAFSMWNKKKDKNYMEDVQGPVLTKLNNDTMLLRDHPEEISPQLAHKYIEKGKKYLTLPFCGSRKFDGVRGIFQLYYTDGTLHKNDEVDYKKIKTYLSSRGKKPLCFMESFRDQLKQLLYETGMLNIILDGEIYSHDIPFNLISGTARVKNKPSEIDHLIKFYVFDIVDFVKPYSERLELLKYLEEQYHNLFRNEDERKIHFELCKIINDYSEVNTLHNKYVQDGYEGIILRNLEGKYSSNRSYDLQKLKNFEDSEFEIIDIEEGSSTEKGASVFVVITKQGHTFKVRPRGTIEMRRGQFKNKKLYIGKLLTVRYQSLNKKTGIPIHGVGIDIRNYE